VSSVSSVSSVEQCQQCQQCQLQCQQCEQREQCEQCEQREQREQCEQCEQCDWTQVGVSAHERVIDSDVTCRRPPTSLCRAIKSRCHVSMATAHAQLGVCLRL